MSFYNGILNHDDNLDSSQVGQRGLPGIGYKLTSDGDYDIQNKKLTNVKNGDENNDVMNKSQIESYVSNKTIYLKNVNPGQVINNKAVIYSNTGSVHSNALYLKDQYGQETILHNEDQDDNQIRLYIPNLKNNDSFGGRLKSSIVITSISQTIEGKKIFHDIEVPNPTIDGHASNKAYVDNEISKISDSSDNSNYVKKSGDSMTGNLNMDGNRILKLSDPQFSDEAVTLGYVSRMNNNLFNSYLDLKGTREMEGNLNMNNNLIQNVKDPINENNATNKKYVDNSISKSIIKPSHIPNNVFKYLMDDVNEWSTEYNVEVKNFINLNEIPHSWNKRVLSISPIKDGKNYRFRLGLQMGPLITNQAYSLVVEMYNRDFVTWERQETFIEGTGIWLKTYNTLKFQHHYGNNNTLYYSKTLIKFNKTSFSGSLTQIYFTIHFDDKGGDLNTYANKFENQIYILAYGALGDINNISPMIYDKHEAFEIEKNKMKMLVDLDMNNNSIINIPLSREGYITIYGYVDSHKIFLKNSNFNLRLRRIHISFITVHGTTSTINNKDIIIINDRGYEYRYNFTFPQSPSLTRIQIDRYFSSIQIITLQNSTNVGFEIDYKLFI